MSCFDLGMLAGSSWDNGAGHASSDTGDIEHARNRRRATSTRTGRSSADENRELLMTWREPRRVSKSLTVQYNHRVIDLLDDTVANRKLIHRYIDVWEYPDGGSRSGRTALPLPACLTTGSPKSIRGR